MIHRSVPTKINPILTQNVLYLAQYCGITVHVSCNVSSPAAGGASLMFGSSTPGASGLQGFLVSPFVEPLHVAVASQEAISRLQFATQQV